MFGRLTRLWRNLVHRDRVERELDDEMRAIEALLVDEHRQAGMPADEAVRRARLALAGVEPVKERVRDVRAGAEIETVTNDVRYAVRLLAANPGFTLVAVLSLGLGIGANSAMFAVANALVWRALPVASPEELHLVRIDSRLPVPQRFSAPLVDDLRRGLPDPHVLAAMSRVTRARLRLDGGEPEAAAVQLVSADYFQVFGVSASTGRLLTPDDASAIGAAPVAVISHAFWRRRLASQPDVVGRELVVNGVRLTVVGVAAEGFAGAWLESPVDAWVPTTMQADLHYAQNFSAAADAEPDRPWTPQAGIQWLDVVVRTAAPAGREAAALNAAFRPHVLEAATRIEDETERRLAIDRRLALQPFAHGASNLRERFRAPMFALMAMTLVLLSIACANTANLLLARATSRQREMAMRLSLGASRGRVVRQLLTESLILGTLAAALGLVLAPIASELLVRMTVGVQSGPLPFSVAVDWRVLVYTALVSLATSALFGVAPAWHATDVALADALRASARNIPRGGRGRLSRALVVLQVALSLLLVVAAGLFLRSLQNLQAAPLGLETTHVVSASINPVLGGYQPEEWMPLYERLVDAAEQLPGVRSASIAMCGLMANCRSSVGGLTISGYQSQPGEEVMLQENYVGPKYFDTVGMTLVEGRRFTERDRTHPESVAIINEAAARRYFANRSPIGQRYGEDRPTVEIVGVVRDARVNTVREAAAPMAFYPIEPAIVAGTLELRTAGDPRAVVAAIRKTISQTEPRLPVDRVSILADQADTTLRQDRLIARLTALLGAMALALASLGLYGILSYRVRQRTAELGIRFALGASRPAVLLAVVRESLGLVLAGLALGVPLALGASRLASALLYEVSPAHPWTLVSAVIVLLTVGAVAGAAPAWRAAHVDPMTALRNE